MRQTLKILNSFTEQTYALLRIMSGLTFLAYGVQKVFGFPSEFPYEMTPLLYAAAAIEIIGGACIVAGLFTRPLAFLASGMSAVGYWYGHGGVSLYPIENGGGLILLYCFIFLYVAAAGGGRFSIDALLAARPRRASVTTGG
jgi:putative oxidoreductase